MLIPICAGVALFLVGLAGPLSAQTIVFTEDFDSGGANWTIEDAPGSETNPTPDNLPGLTYTTGSNAVNEDCNNYWVINDAHTPDSTNIQPGAGGFSARGPCSGNQPGNNSLHITFKSCALMNQIGNFLSSGPDYGDEYSWYDDAHSGTESFASASDQWAFMNTGFSTAGFTDPLTLQFSYYIGGDQDASLTDRSVLISTDGGTTWEVLAADIPYTIADHFLFGSCTQWQVFQVNLPPAALNNPDVRLAFRWRNDNPNGMTTADYSYASAFNIDNIVVLEEPPTNNGWTAEIFFSSNPACKNIPVQLGAVFPISPPYNAPNLPTFDYDWTITPLGGGTATFVGGTTNNSPNPEVEFSANGQYQVELFLEVTVGSEVTDTTILDTIDIGDCPPTAIFDPGQLSVCATSPTPVPGSVTQLLLEDLSESVPTITNWSWTFAPNTVTFLGGTNANSQNPEVSFDSPGNYDVTLTVTNDEGLNDDTTIVIAVIDCECNLPGGGGGGPTGVTIFEEDFTAPVDFNINQNVPGLGGVPSGGAPLFNNTWTIGGTFTGGCGSHAPQPAGITNPNTDYLFMSEANFCGGGPGYGSFIGSSSDIHVANTDLQSSGTAISTTGFTNVEISFWYKNNDNDGEWYIRSPGTGGTWTQIQTISSQTTWTQVTYTNAAQLDNQTYLEIAFVYGPATTPATDPPLAIDDVIVTGDQTGGGTAPNGLYICPVSSPICDGADFDVNFNGVGDFTGTPANAFDINLYDVPAIGATPIATLATITTANSVDPSVTETVTLPPGTAPGTYYLRVTSTNPVFESDSVEIEVINGPDLQAITGDTLVCFNSNAVPYSVPPEAGVNYSWSVGGVDNSVLSSNNNQALMNFGATTGSFPVTVDISNTCDTVTVDTNVTVYQPNPIGSINGPQSVCQGDLGVQYVLTPVNPGATLTWSVTGGSIASGQGTDTITVDWTAPNGVYQVQVIEETTCGTIDSVDIPVAVTGQPGIPDISGPTPICDGDSALYFITPETGVTYTWTVVSGNVNFLPPPPVTGASAELEATGTGAAQIQVEATNGCGTQTDVFDIDVVNTFALDTLFGDTSLCNDGNPITTTYSYPFIPGYSYSWTLTGEQSVTGSLTSNSIDVTWDPAAPNWEVTLEITAPCGTDQYTQPVTQITAVDSSQFPITGPVSACLGAGNVLTYSVPNAGSVSYTWLADPADASIIGSSTTNSVDLEWLQSGNLQLAVEVDGATCGIDTSFITVAVQELNLNCLFDPNPVVAGATLDYTGTYSGTPPIAGAVDYEILWGDFSAIETGSNATSPLTSSHVYLNPGFYTAEVVITDTATGCADTCTEVIEVDDVPPPTITIVDPGANNITLCVTENLVIGFDTTNFDPGATFTLEYSTDGFVTDSNTICTGATVGTGYDLEFDCPLPGGLTAGTYDLRVRGETPYGVSTVLTLTVVDNFTAADFPIAGDLTACAGENLLYSVPLNPQATYNWSLPNGGGSIASGQGTEEITVNWTAGGTHTVEVEVVTNCGSPVPTVDVAVQEVALSCVFDPNPVIEGGTVDFTGTYTTSPAADPLDFELLWGDGSPVETGSNPASPLTSSHVYTTGGNYTAQTIVTDPVTGCADTCSETIVVGDLTLALGTPAPGATDTICAGQSISTAFTAEGFPAGTSYFLEYSADGFVNDSATVCENPVSDPNNPPNGLLFDACAFPDTAGTYTLRVRADGPYTVTQTYTLVVLPQTTADFSFSAAACPGDAIDFLSLANSTVNCQWDFGDGATSSDCNPTHAYNAAGDYDVSFTVGPPACPSTATQTLTVNDTPTVDVTANPAELQLPEVNTTTFRLEDATDISSYTWIVPPMDDTLTGSDLQEVQASFIEEGSYTAFLTVTDQNGCVGRGNATVVATQEEFVFVPNVFTPSGDGINDFLRLTIRAIESMEVSIYSRWGVQVHSENFNSLAQQSQVDIWDGTQDGNAAPEGVYVYTITYVTNEGVEQTRTGSVTLLR